MRYCSGCMARIDDAVTTCPHCGYARDAKQREAYHMAPDTMLYERYIVGRVLGYGGFGVTYIGWDLTLERKVAIKEYLPSTFATRIPGEVSVSVYSGVAAEQFLLGRDRFVEEAQRLAAFNGVPGIVDIYDAFAQNNTAYIVMQYLDGEDVKGLLAKNGPMPYTRALPIIRSVGETLELVHRQGILHRDISPDNIFITRKEEIKLLDFGAARQASSGNSKSLSVILKSGYAPEEQYRSRGRQGTWTDVYALAATFYKMLTGITPEDAMERAIQDDLKRPGALGVEMPAAAEAALLNALQVRQENRTQDMPTFLSQLESSQVREIKASAAGRQGGLKKPPVALLAGGGALAIAILALGIVVLFPQPAGEQTPELVSTQAVTSAPTPVSTPTPISTPTPTIAPTEPEVVERYARTTTDSAPVYFEPSLDSGVLDTVPDGEIVYLDASFSMEDGLWYQVNHKNLDGYISALHVAPMTGAEEAAYVRAIEMMEAAAAQTPVATVTAAVSETSAAPVVLHSVPTVSPMPAATASPAPLPTVNPTPTQANGSGYAVIMINGTFFRDGASMDSEVIGKLSGGAVLRVISETETNTSYIWYYCEADGIYGYVRADMLQLLSVSDYQALIAQRNAEQESAVPAPTATAGPTPSPTARPTAPLVSTVHPKATPSPTNTPIARALAAATPSMMPLEPLEERFERGEYEGLLAELDAVLVAAGPEYGPEHAPVYDLIARTNAAMGDIDAAIEAHERAVELAPEESIYWTEYTSTLGRHTDLTDETLRTAEKAYALNPEGARESNNLGAAWGRMGNTEKAYEYYGKAVALMPDSLLYQLNYGNALFELGRYDDLYDAAQIALALDPDSAEAWNLAGLAYEYHLMDDEKAMECYGKAIALEPDYEQYRENWRLALGRIADGMAEGAEPVRIPQLGIVVQTIFSDSDEPTADTLPRSARVVEVELDSSVVTNSFRVNDMITEVEGKRIYTAEELAAAVQRYRAGAEIWVRSYRIRDGKDFADATSSNGMTIVQAVAPEERISLLDMAQALYDDGQYDEAMEIAESALEETPEDARVPGLIGLAHGQLGDYEDALSYAERAIELAPEEGEYWATKALAQMCLGMNKEALQSADKAVELSPGDVEVLKSVCWVMLELERYEEVHLYANQILASDPGVHYAWYMRAKASSGAGDVEAAITHIEKALLLKSDDADYLVEYCYCLLVQERYQEALENAEKVTRLEPDRVIAWTYIATASRDLRDFKSAREAIDRALELEQNDVVLWSIKSEICYALGDIVPSLEAIEKALELDPGNKTYQHNRDYLKEVLG